MYPDADADKVRKLADERASVWEGFRSAPCSVFDDEADGPSRMHDAFLALVDRLERQVVEYWMELRGIELLVGEAAEEFGEDPAVPEIRAIMDWMRLELIELRDQLKSSHGEYVALPEPDNEQMAMLRGIAHWPLENNAP